MRSALVCVLVCACNTNEAQKVLPTADTLAVPTPDAPTSVALSPLPPAVIGDAGAAVDSIGAVAQEIYPKLTEPNAFYSPASLTIALAMTYGGAHGETAKQMEKVLHLSPSAPAWGSFASLIASLTPADKGVELRVANRLYGQKTLAFAPTFLSLTKDTFNAPLERLDFTSGDASKPINDWVSAQTNAKIQDLIPAGSLTPLTRLVLVNAIYFKGAWKRTFDSSATKSEPFFGKNGQKDVPFMHQRGHVQYFERSDSQVLELPYAGDALVMDVILPKTKDGLPAVERVIASSGFGGFTGGLMSREVVVALPKFKITYEFEASKALAELGMPLAFSDAGDFGGMTNKTDKVHIDKVFHKAFVDVGEQGTEAAGATGIVMGVAGAPPTPTEPIHFRADHPFVFVIRDLRSNAILFAGRLSDATPSG